MSAPVVASSLVSTKSGGKGISSGSESLEMLVVLATAISGSTAGSKSSQKVPASTAETVAQPSAGVGGVFSSCASSPEDEDDSLALASSTLLSSFAGSAGVSILLLISTTGVEAGVVVAAAASSAFAFASSAAFLAASSLRFFSR